MEAIEAILTRRSTRRYAGEMPERALVEKVIEAGEPIREPLERKGNPVTWVEK